MTTVRELITRMGFDVDYSPIDKIPGKVEPVVNRIKGMLAGAAAAFSVQALISIADEMQSVRTRIGQLPQTIGEAGAAFDEVAQHAIDAGMSIDAYAGLYLRVGNAAKEILPTQRELLGITDTISQALVVGGASAQEAASVMLQFAQALGSGVLQGDEFRSMAEAAPQYLDQLAVAMGIPREQLKKMGSEGKLTSKAVIAATQKMSAYFQQRFMQMPMTVGRAMTVVNARWSRMVDQMNRESGTITTMANGIIAVFDAMENAATSLIGFLGGGANAMRLFGFAMAAAFGLKAIQMLKAFRLASLQAMLPYLAWAALVAALALVFEDLYVWISGGQSVVGDIIGTFDGFKATLASVGMTIGGVARFFGLLAGAGASLAVIIGTMRAAMLAYQGVVVALTVVQGIYNAVMMLNPMALFLIAIVAVIAAGVALVANWQAVSAWFHDFFDGIGQRIDGFIEKVKGLGSLLPSFLGGTGGDVKVSGGVPSVAPGAVASAGRAGAGAQVNNNTTVNLTVPAGTPKEQQAFLQGAANKSFAAAPKSNTMASDIATHSR